MKFRWTLIAGLALMTSCGKEIPSDIIQPEQMESVLYDYHLAMGINQNSKNTEKEAQKQFVFQKHGVTEAEFDSSMVWYTRESVELMDIYTNLEKRFNRELKHVERLLEIRNEAGTRTFESGDTVDVWRKENLYWLAKTPINSHLTFEIKADTTFHGKDAFSWDMEYFFMKPGEAVMGMSVIYENDSVVGHTQRVSESGPQNIYLRSDSAFKVKEIQGFIYVPNEKEHEPNILIHNISLTRYHDVATDSLNADSIRSTGTKVVEPIRKKERPRRMEERLATPDEKVQMEESGPKE